MQNLWFDYVLYAYALVYTFTRTSLTARIVNIMVTEDAACDTCHVSWPRVLDSPRHWLRLIAGHIRWYSDKWCWYWLITGSWATCDGGHSSLQTTSSCISMDPSPSHPAPPGFWCIAKILQVNSRLIICIIIRYANHCVKQKFPNLQSPITVLQQLSLLWCSLRIVSWRSRPGNWGLDLKIWNNKKQVQQIHDTPTPDPDRKA